MTSGEEIKMINEHSASRKRILYLDVLKIIALFAVICIHIVGGKFGFFSPGSPEWNGVNLVDSLSRWCVPVFVMVSGALFLDPDKPFDVKKLYSKNIVRLVAAFFFWSFLYALYSWWNNNFSGGLLSVLKATVVGEYHMWFIFMIVGLYVITPPLRLVAKNEKVLTYTICIIFLLMTVNGYAGVFPSSTSISAILEDANLNPGYIGYYLLGWWLKSHSLSSKCSIALCGFGMVGFAVTYLATLGASLEYCETGLVSQYYEYCTLNVALMSVAVFVAVKSIVEWLEARVDFRFMRILVSEIANLSLGIYLMHVFFFWWLAPSVSDGLFPVVYLYAMLVYVVTCVAAYLLRRIPAIGVYLT